MHDEAKVQSESCMLNFLKGKPFISYLLVVALLTLTNSYMVPLGMLKLVIHLKIQDYRSFIEVFIPTANAFYDSAIIFSSIYFNEYRLNLNSLQSIELSVNIDLWVEKLTFVKSVLIVCAYFAVYFYISYALFSFGTFFNGLFYLGNSNLFGICLAVAIILALYWLMADLSLIANAPLAAVFRKIRLSLCKQKG